MYNDIKYHYIFEYILIFIRQKELNILKNVMILEISYIFILIKCE
jgi:hypothetical protein